MALAEHYSTVWVEEYAREYLRKLNRAYGYEDILNIARGQYMHEEEMKARANRILFCDTDMLVCKIWSEFRYGRSDPWIERMAGEHRYDLYLLCDIDLPWEQDPLREHPHRRKELFDLYLYELKRMEAPFEVIRGRGAARVDQAISIIDRTFKKIFEKDGQKR